MDVKPGSSQLFEGLNDRFTATVTVPGKGATPEVTPEVAPEVVSRLQKSGKHRGLFAANRPEKARHHLKNGLNPEICSKIADRSDR